MNTIITILLILAGIIVLLLIVALFMKKEHYVKREIIINTSSQKVFDFLKMLKNQEKFNKYASADPNKINEYKGTDGTVGFIHSWGGNKDAGCGEKEITNIIEGKKIETEIRFVKPMKTSANIVIDIESLSDNQTKITWSNAGTLIYPLNIFIPKFQKTFAKDMDESLATLKSILENHQSI
jgi:hypothetical protein